MLIRALIISIVLCVVCAAPIYAQTTYQNPIDVCGSSADIRNTNQLSTYEICLQDNEGTLLYLGECGGTGTRETSFAANDYCEWFVLSVVPSAQNNGSSGTGGFGANGGATSVLISVFGLMSILSMARIGGY